MRDLVDTCERVGSTSKRLEKTSALADYFNAATVDEAAQAAIFLSGEVFPAHEETILAVGGALLWKAVQAVANANEGGLVAAYREHGDLGSATFDLFQTRAREGEPLSVIELGRCLREIARAKGPAAKQKLLERVLARAEPLEAKYVVKIITSDLRIGSKESLVEEAIGKAFEQDVAKVQRANMLLGDVGAALRLAREGKLDDAKLTLFHPIGFMLASPAKDVAEAIKAFEQRLVEDKYDGIRAQAHVGRGKVRLYSRTRDDITESFPELVPALLGVQGEALLDGEILAWDAERQRARSFGDLQKRIGRKKPSVKLQREVPVAFVAFDVLYRDGELTMDRPLLDRGVVLNEILEGKKAPIVAPKRGQLGLFDSGADADPVGEIVRAPASIAETDEDLDRLFVEARARNNEGLMVKDLASPYAAGRRGKQWLKVKRELATLDVVVTGVEWGHGRRAKVLSDYTFAVRGEAGELLDIGKAYSGLTDAEIVDKTAWFKEHTVEDRGFFRTVEPTLVLEVAFDRIMKSERHPSGYALRFPRILRLREDKPASEADDLAAVEKIFASQT